MFDGRTASDHFGSRATTIGRFRDGRAERREPAPGQPVAAEHPETAIRGQTGRTRPDGRTGFGVVGSHQGCARTRLAATCPPSIGPEIEEPGEERPPAPRYPRL